MPRHGVTPAGTGWCFTGIFASTTAPADLGAGALSLRVRRALGASLAVLTLVACVSQSAPARGAAAVPEHDEWHVLNLMNSERRAAGLRPLAMVEGARKVARQWAAVIASEGALRHNPDLLPQMEKHFSDFTRAGENVGRGAHPQEVHAAFMNSPGHRANILGAFRYVGVGVVHVGDRIWLTVDFIEQAPAVPFIVRVPLARVAGGSDPDTSVLLSRRLATKSASAVVVARTDDFADALAGSALAVRNRGPLLLSPTNGAPSNLVEEAARVLAADGTVYLLGGPAALAPQVELQFGEAGLRVVRLAGSDRFGTATAVAPHVNPAPTEVFLASGLSFPDAVVAGAPAGARATPVLLVGPTSLPPATQLYLTSHPSARRVLIGGPASVGEAVAVQAGVAERVFGADRFATSVAVAQKWFPTAARVAVASGSRFQDALVASAEAGRDRFPVVLASWPTADSTYTYVAGRTAIWAAALAVGRPGDLTDDTVVLLFS